MCGAFPGRLSWLMAMALPALPSLEASLATSLAALRAMRREKMLTRTAP